MRIALVVAHLGLDGTARVATLLAGCWAARGETVTLLTCSRERAFFLLPPAVDLAVLPPARHERERPMLLPGWRRALRRAWPDVIVAFGDRTAVRTLAATRGTRVPVVVSERRDPHRFPIGGPTWRMLRRALYRDAAAVVVQTQSVARRYPPPWRPLLRVIPNPVVVPGGPAVEDEGASEPRIVALGRLAPEKGFDLLVRAFGQVAPGHPEWTLTIWGEGPERRRLETLRAELGLAGRVRLPGATTAPAKELRAGAIFALPSRSEGFPNALCEALACGLPAIAADCRDGPGELIRDGIDGLLVPPESAPALAEALDRLMSDPAERARLAAGTQAARERFSLAAVIARWDRVLEEATERGDRRPRRRQTGGQR